MSLFVAGTDTGVGKTVLTAGIVGWLRREGIDATAIKPCQTGYPEDDDARFVIEVCGDEDAATCLERLGPPLAPAVAARETSTALSYDRIVSGCRERIEARNVAIVEGIGGLRVPLADGSEVVDLVADLDLPTLVVARSGLGTLNHTALTAEALRRRGVSVVGVVLNEYEGTDLAERTNPAVIEAQTDLPVATLPPVAHDGDGLENDGAALIDAVAESLPESFRGE
ncbi:dethiobiotin synthase [Halobacteriales archaeon QS_4_62_28]|nr:MAG: dethiobiotin synthase [Halobacteriales archaeon QS_4_62_28]